MSDLDRLLHDSLTSPNSLIHEEWVALAIPTGCNEGRRATWSGTKLSYLLMRDCYLPHDLINQFATGAAAV